MKAQQNSKTARFVLFSNGVVDIFAAIALFFPLFNLPLPGYTSYTNLLSFVSGGWGIAALTFGIGRIWTSYKPEFYWVMVILGLIEGVFLSMYSLINVIFFDLSWLHVMLSFCVGSIFGILYFVALISLSRLDKAD
jgi:hypothetical protein